MQRSEGCLFLKTPPPNPPIPLGSVQAGVQAGGNANNWMRATRREELYLRHPSGKPAPIRFRHFPPDGG